MWLAAQGEMWYTPAFEASQEQKEYEKESSQSQRDGIILWCAAVERAGTKIGPLLRQTQAQAGQGEAQQERAQPVDGFTLALVLWREENDAQHQEQHDRNIEVEDGGPAEC